MSADNNEQFDVYCITIGSNVEGEFIYGVNGCIAVPKDVDPATHFKNIIDSDPNVLSRFFFIERVGNLTRPGRMIDQNMDTRSNPDKAALRQFKVGGDNYTIMWEGYMLYFSKLKMNDVVVSIDNNWE